MTYRIETIIDVPLEKFISIYANTDHLKNWQRGLMDIEHISGTPNEYGAKMKLTYNIGGKVIEMIETVEISELPHQYAVTFYSSGIDNKQHNYFSHTEDNNTLWVSVNEFYPLNLKMRLFTLLMPGSFKKQTKRYMKDFKNYAEKGIEVPRKD